MIIYKQGKFIIINKQGKFIIINKQGKFIIINKQDSKQTCTCATLRTMEIHYLVRVSARTDFSTAPKSFIIRRRLLIFTMKVPRFAFGCAQVLEWVLRNNCNCYLVFFLCFWTVSTIRNRGRVERGSE